MTEDFFDFLTTPTSENFKKAQLFVMGQEHYDPYAKNLDTIIAFLDGEDYESALNDKNISTILSPGAHLMKQYAARMLEDEKSAETEGFLAEQIFKCLLDSGDGTQENPFEITQLTDERDILQKLEEEFNGQSLWRDGERSLDCVDTKSGKKLYFDISIIMKLIEEKGIEDSMLESAEEEINEFIVVEASKEENTFEFEIDSPINHSPAQPSEIDEDSNQIKPNASVKGSHIENEDDKKWWKFW